MNLTLRELNELIYCIDVARKHGQLLGTTVADTLAVRLRDELDRRLAIEDDSNYLTIPTNKEVDTNPKVNRIHIEEDVFTKILNNVLEPKIPKGVTQSILDYVEFMGDASHTQIHNFYKITFGSNSFSHILRSLIIPYKNRPTRRYLYKTLNGRYVVKQAQLYNWIEKDY